MYKGLDYIKETIKLRQEDIAGNAQETNDLLIDDLLIALGYNRRRDAGIKRVYENGVNWRISHDGESRFIIGTYGYGSELPSKSEIDAVIEFAKEHEFKFSLLTDGKQLTIYETEDRIITVPDIYNDTVDSMLESLSSKDWSPKGVYQAAVDQYVTVDMVRSTIKANISDMAKQILSAANLDISNILVDLAIESIQNKLADMLDGSIEARDNTVDTTDGNNDLIEAKQQEIDKLNAELDELRQQLEDKTSNDTTDTDETTGTYDVENLRSEIEEKASKINELNNTISNLQHQLDQSNPPDAEIGQLKDEIGRLQLENETLQNQLSETPGNTSTEVESLTAQIAKLQEENNTLKSLQSSDDATSKVQILTAENEELSVKLKKAEEAATANVDKSELDRLKAEVARLESENKTLAEQSVETVASMSSSAASDDYNELKSELETLRAENDELKESIRISEEEAKHNNTSNDAVVDLRRQLARLNIENDRLRAVVDSDSMAQITALTAENDGLRAQIEELKKVQPAKASDAELEALRDKVAQLTKENQVLKDSSLTTELNDKITELQLANSELRTELEKSKAETVKSEASDTETLEKLESVVKENETLKSTNIMLSNETASLRSQVEKLQSENAELNKPKEYIEGEEESAEALKAELAKVKAAHEAETVTLNAQLSVKEQRLSEMNGVVDKLNTDNSKLKQVIEELKTANDNPEYDEAAYREQIAQLTSDKQNLILEVSDLKKKMHDLEEKYSNKESDEAIMARELLEAVEDNDNQPRTYVGVVNGKLFQMRQLTKFVGACLQELYGVVNFDMMHLLFDGDIFKMVQPAERIDLIINARTYDIDIGELAEDDVIARLKTFMGKFSDRTVFMCKIIGSTDITEDDVVELKKDETENTEQTETVAEEDTEATNATIQIDEDQAKQFGNVTLLEDKCLGLALCDVGSILWGEANPIKGVLAIGDEYRLFKVGTSSYAEAFTDGLISLISVGDSVVHAIDTLNNTELDSVSSSIHINKQSDDDVQILNTEYYAEITDTQKCISTLLALADILEVNTAEVYMYLDAYCYEGSDLEPNYINISDLVTDTRYDIDSLQERTEVIHAIISGCDLLKLIDINKSLGIEKDSISNVVAVRTKFGNFQLRNNDEIAKVVNMLMAKLDIEAVPRTVDKINSQFNEFGKIFLGEDDDSSVDAAEVSVGTYNYYIDSMPSYITTVVIMSLYREIIGDDSVDIRVELNSPVYLAFKEGIDTADSKEYMSSRLFVEAVGEKTKTISQ